MDDDQLLHAAEVFALPHYREPHRAYHDERHIRHMLAALAARGVTTPTLVLAVWGHDLIYDPKASDNEELSADAFDAWLTARGASSETRADVRTLILATRHRALPATRAEALLVDADLSILGAERVEFAAYDAAIRREYAHVPALQYRVGRWRVLQGFLARERIYTTAEFAGLEAQARANLKWTLRKLAFLPF